MIELINQINFHRCRDVFLFFDENRISEEVKKNLVTISAIELSINDDDRKVLLNTLLQIVENIEMSLKNYYPGRPVKFYLWFDQGESVLRWTIISDMNQKELPFSSKIKEVTIEKIIENWFPSKQKIFDDDSPLFSGIDDMSAYELRALMNSLEVPSLEVFVRHFK